MVKKAWAFTIAIHAGFLKSVAGSSHVVGEVWEWLIHGVTHLIMCFWSYLHEKAHYNFLINNDNNNFLIN